MFFKKKPQIKTQFDQILLNAIYDTQEKMQIAQQKNRILKNTNPTMVLTEKVEKGKFAFLYHQARLRQVDAKTVAQVMARRYE